MMPGDSHAKSVAIAADAMVGNCRNCTTLHQNLTEYVASFLALKQKIITSDDTIRLQKQQEELQIRLVTLEKKSADYEFIQTQLEEKKRALAACGHISEEMEKLKQANNETIAKNKMFEEQLKDVKEQHSLEYSQLKREKAEIENDLLQTQTSLKKSQAQAEHVEKLTEENTKITSRNCDLENQVKELDDSICKRNQQISKLTKEKLLLERHFNDLRVRLLKLERERNKEFRSTSTQANPPKEHKVDKEQVRMLLENLWACVEPQRSINQLHLPDDTLKHCLNSPQFPASSLQSKHSPHNNHTSHVNPGNKVASHSDTTLTTPSLALLKPCPPAQSTSQHQLSPQQSGAKKKSKTPKKKKRISREHEPGEKSTDSGSLDLSIAEILEQFKPMPTCLSPIVDMEIEIKSMETVEGEKENHPNSSADAVPPHEDSTETLTMASVSSHCPNPLALPAENDLNIPVDAAKEVEQNHAESICEDPEQSKMTVVGESKDNGEELNLQNAVLTAQQATAPVQLTSDDKVVKSQEVSCSGDPCSSVTNGDAESEGASEKPDEGQPETEMDVDVSDGTGAMVVKSPRGSDDSATPAHAPQEASIPDTEIVSEAEQSHQDSASVVEESPEASVAQSGMESAHGKSTRMEVEDNVRTPGSGNNLENGEQIKPSELVNCKNEHKEDLDKPCSFQESLNNGTGKCGITPELKSDHAENVPAEQNCDAVSVETTSGKQVEEDTLNKDTEDDYEPSISETLTIDCEPLKGNTPSPCERLSPSHFSPTVKEQESEALSNSGPLVLNVDFDMSRTEETSALEDVPRDSVDSGGPALPIATPNGDHDSSRALVKPSDPAAPASPVVPERSPRCLGEVQSKVGPPLPPLLTPLSTPPKAGRSISPRQAIGKLSFPSPMASHTTPVLRHTTPNRRQLRSSSLTSPLSSNGVPSSPLLFGSATPKHAVPVPGRLPLAAMSSSPSASSSPSQENSMRMLDTMYPELSARARTLSILRGNVNLAMCSSEGGTLPTKSDGQMSGFKTINSASTAFTKTETRGEKRQASCMPEIKSSKCPRLNSHSPVSGLQQGAPCPSKHGENTTSLQSVGQEQLKDPAPSMGIEEHSNRSPDDILKRLEMECFDLLVVIQSHLFVGNLPKKPVMRDEEKEAISDIFHSNLADEMTSAILNKLKTEKMKLSKNYVQSLCRVYTGICRQQGDWLKARIFAYNILTEDFPDAAKLILFMVTTWPGLLSHCSTLCRAIHTITKLKAPADLLSCLSALLNWEKNPPCDIEQLISESLSDLRSGSNLSFAAHSRLGWDLGTQAWDCIFTLQLLCTHKEWKWTYENLLGKELWPLMNTWVMQPRDQQAPVSDVTVAAVLRLIGCLCQLGMKENIMSSVLTVAKVINTFGRHGQTEGVPWEVQLAAVHCIYELSPSNPKQALDALAGWREETSQTVPPAVMSYINQLGCICRQSKS